MPNITMDGKYRTRNGLAVRVLCVDLKSHTNEPVLAAIQAIGGLESVYTFSESGAYRLDKNCSHDYDLIEIPSPPKPIPFTRDTWPGSRYVKPCEFDEAQCVGTVLDDGIIVGNLNPRHVTWKSLFDGYLHGDSHKTSGPWHECQFVE